MCTCSRVNCLHSLLCVKPTYSCETGEKRTEKSNKSFIYFWDVLWKCVYDEISEQISTSSLSQLSCVTLLTPAEQTVLWGYWNIKIKIEKRGEKKQKQACMSLKQGWTITQDTDKKGCGWQDFRLSDGPCYEVHTMQTPLFPWRPIVIPSTHYTCKHSPAAFGSLSKQTCG